MAAPKGNQDNYDSSMTLSLAAKLELSWWESNLPSSFKLYLTDGPHVFIQTNSCLDGWCAVTFTPYRKVSGKWDVNDKSMRINVLEMRAILMGLTALCL
ncbi:hypothetical protein HOLleu_43359 [Holothuria leucospilota]|uniref:Uncharacterized protein n=1 Tax=Holothuria leucospilota TaxID=206669 RepID=A0A9Q1B9R5_HOLLE|nr:hypothetical protein HOLleu_43359 [Holothuria leucospilota]